MALYSRCSVCGCNIPYRTKVCDKCKPIYDKEQKDKYRMYDNNDAIRKLRHTTRWRKLREDIIDVQKGLCLMCYIEGEYNPVDHIHHITEAQDDLNLFYDKDNLVGLCEDHHKFLHSRKILGKEKFEKFIEEKINKNKIY